MPRINDTRHNLAAASLLVKAMLRGRCLRDLILPVSLVLELVPKIHSSACSDARGEMDLGHKARDET
jgi:hypothetical protein